MDIQVKYLPGQTLFFLHENKVCSGTFEKANVNIFSHK